MYHPTDFGDAVIDCDADTRTERCPQRVRLRDYFQSGDAY